MTSDGATEGRLFVAVGRKLRLGLTAVRPGVDLDGPLYAVNLLDRKRPRLYELYNLLAFPFARKARARVLFKGHRVDSSLGESLEESLGETLLVVRYPAGKAFLRMITRPAFALISVLRKGGLKNFQFGFAERLPEDGTEPRPSPVPRRYRGQARYLVLAARGAEAPGVLQRLADAGREQAVETLFLGHTAAVVAMERAGRDPRPTAQAPPLPWDALLVLEGDGLQGIEALTRIQGRTAPDGVVWAAARFHRVL